MGTLAALLRCLERDDVTEVRLQSDAVAAAARGGTYSPLTKAPLTTAQIEQILQGTPVLPVLQQSTTEVRGQLDMSIGAAAYSVSVMRHADRVQIRFFRSGEGADGGAPRAAAAPAAAEPATVVTPSPLAARAAPVSAPVATPAPAMAPTHAAPAAPRRATAPKDPRAREELTALLAQARQQKASDVHVFADQPIRVRRNGELTTQGEPIRAAKVESMMRSVMSEGQEEDLIRQGYADLSLELPKVGRLRVNIGKQSLGFKGCFRLVSDVVPTLESLGLPKDLENVAHYHQGLAVISGPNGAGKTTTMAAIVDIVNASSPHHIITVEDPVEIIHPVKKALMSQREVGAHTRSFARALKAALREDPDVIVIGELRDRETVEIALSAAETGHLVIATMSTRSASKTIDRLIDLFPPDLQSQVRATLAGALKIIVSQRLLPGAKGEMVAAAELITGSVPLWNLIRDNKLFQLPSLQQRGRSLGMIKFDTSLEELVRAGRITEEVAKKNAENAVELEKALRAPAQPAPGAAGAGAKPRPGLGKKEGG